ncbi:MAG: peptidoglycan-binding protein [Alphaproteobacteria bacterium]|nr:peptidoglycan-binding protein [Alphaproteobacteria bacterium]
MTSVSRILAAAALVAALTASGSTIGHAQDSTLLGAGAGAGGGAGVGFALGGPVGAVVGGLLGAGVGAGAGHAIGKDDKARQSSGGYAPSSQGDVTAAVQGELNAAGYDAGPADGRLGPRTSNAIRAYQAHNGLPQDGYPSMALLDHLRAKRAAATGAQPAPAAYQPAPPPAPAGATPGAAPTVPALPPPAASTQQTGGANCKPYESRLMVDGKETVTRGTACLQADGSWRPVN